MEDLERELVTRPDMGHAIDGAEPACGDLGIDPKSPIEDLSQQRIAPFYNRALMVFLFRCHAHTPF
jgi:hypothetical protein